MPVRWPVTSGRVHGDERGVFSHVVFFCSSFLQVLVLTFLAAASENIAGRYVTRPSEVSYSLSSSSPEIVWVCSPILERKVEGVWAESGEGDMWSHFAERYILHSNVLISSRKLQWTRLKGSIASHVDSNPACKIFSALRTSECLEILTMQKWLKMPYAGGDWEVAKLSNCFSSSIWRLDTSPS